MDSNFSASTTKPGHGLGLQTPTASLQKSKTPTNKCPGYDTKQFDDEVPVMLELWEMQEGSSLQSFPGPLWLGKVASERFISMGQIELFDVYTVSEQMTYTKLNC